MSINHIMRRAVLALDFNERTGTTVFDGSSKAHNGTFGPGAAAPTWVAGKDGSGGALGFDGGNYVQLSSFALSGTVLTLLTRINCGEEATHQTIFGDAAQSTTVGFIWLRRPADSDALAFKYANGTSVETAYSTEYFTGYNDTDIDVIVVCDYAAKTCDFYRNGIFVNRSIMNGTPVFPTTDRVRYIGAYNDGPLYGMIGTIDDVFLLQYGFTPIDSRSIYGHYYPRYEKIFHADKDDDVFTFNPKVAPTRMCLPTDWEASRFYGWDQKDATEKGNPYIYTQYYSVRAGKLAQLMVNTGTSVYTHPLPPKYNESVRTFAEAGTNLVYGWSHDKPNNKFSFESYLDNDLEETSPTVLYDDDETYWAVTSWGAGTIGAPTVSEELTEKIKGTSSTEIIVPAGALGRSGVKHIYGPAADWSAKEFMCLYIYGANSGTFMILAQTAGGNYFLHTITDNWTGWKRLVIPFEVFTITGAPDWASIAELSIVSTSEKTWYLDRTVIDVGQWVKVEVSVPDALATGLTATQIYLRSWSGAAYLAIMRWDAHQVAGLSYNNVGSGNGHLLDGTKLYEIYGDNDGNTAYGIGVRDNVKAPYGFSDGDAGNITYSSYHGCIKRIGFAIKLPPDDGQDGSTTGISQIKLELIVYYDNNGLTTYEFEDSDYSLYGLDKKNANWLALFNTDTDKCEFLITSNRLTGLTMTADEDELITELTLILPKGTIVYHGYFEHNDLTLDSDSDGVPDFLDEELNQLPSLARTLAHLGWV